MEQVTYCKLNLRKSHGHRPKARPAEVDSSTVVYADIRTAASQCHLPVDDPGPDLPKKNLIGCNYKTLSGVLVLIIVLLCCALGYTCMDYLTKRSDQDKNCDKIKDICLNSNSSRAGCQLCPYNWLPYRDQCYYYSDVTGRTWNQSRDDCKEMGADLLVIKDRDQEEFIQRNLMSETYWIGLRCDGEDCRWLDGGYYNSSQFKVKTRTQSSDHCAVLNRSGYYQDNCNSTYKWICLKKALKIELS